MRKTITVTEAKDSLGCKLRKVYYLFRDGELEGYRVGASIRIYADAVEAYKERRSNKQPIQTLPMAPELPKKAKVGRPRNSTPFTGFRHLQF